MADSLHDFTARSLDGEDIPLSRYRGQVVLVVNTASRCGFTPQLRGLEALYREFRPQGFVVLAFPCNQFGQQEPGDAAAIRTTCQSTYGVTFPVFAKIEVKGPGAHPLYRWLTAQLTGLLGRDIRWNFTKFLIGRDGRPLERFAPLKPPGRLRAVVAAAVAAPTPVI